MNYAKNMQKKTPANSCQLGVFPYTGKNTHFWKTTIIVPSNRMLEGYK